MPFCMGLPLAGRPVSPARPEESSQKYEALVEPFSRTLSEPDSAPGVEAPAAAGSAETTPAEVRTLAPRRVAARKRFLRMPKERRMGKKTLSRGNGEDACAVKR